MRRLLTCGLGMLGALWTLLVLGVPAALHPCPAHATSVESSADHGGHGDHAAHHPTESALDTTADPEQKRPGCACIDCGCATAPLALGHATVVRLGPSPAPPTPVRGRHVGRHRPSRGRTDSPSRTVHLR